MAELFAGKPLINQKGENLDGGDALRGKKVVALYFSAMWCGSCRQFTPKLKRFYEAVKAAGKEIEIVLVSRDRAEEDLLEYLGHGGDWVAIPFGDDRIQEYLKKYEVPTIPAFKLINSAGELLHDARADVTERGKDEPVAVFDEWAEKFPHA
uniref:Thioredoxin domain-containing protein n=1 Tax=Caenorhabditis japonica TaxID=281687 RepID=A0A8R1DLD7_CAEJA